MDRNRTRSGGSSRDEASASVADEEIASWLARTQKRSQASGALPALSSWTRQMERYPQLTAVAQAELAADFQAGLVAEVALDQPGRRAVREERRLRAVVERGKYAIEYLTASNFRLVTLIAREKAEERWGRERAAELLPDLVGEANIALVEAARVFNPNAGPSFPTYAARVIRDRMLMMLTRDHPIKLPPSWTRIKRIVAVRTPALAADLGRQPTREELEADLLKQCMQWAFNRLSDEERELPQADREQKQVERLRKQGMLGAIEHLDEVLVYTQSLGYLDAPLGDEGGSLGDIISEGAPSMTAGVEAEQLRAAVAEVLAGLPDRDREIICYRYGFIDGECWAYQKISERYGVSAERIRQIEKAAIAKLRLPGAGEVLGDFLDHQLDIDK